MVIRQLVEQSKREHQIGREKQKDKSTKDKQVDENICV